MALVTLQEYVVYLVKLTVMIKTKVTLISDFGNGAKVCLYCQRVIQRQKPCQHLFLVNVPPETQVLC